MKEKLILSSPEAANIFTPEELERMNKDARKKEMEEKIRLGEETEYGGPGPEEFNRPVKAADNKISGRAGFRENTSRKNFENYKKQRKDIFN